MQPEIHSGYLGLFRPPYTLDSNRGKQSTIYCISTQYQEVLVLIPLVPNFFADLYRFVIHAPMTRYYIIAPDVSLPFISDYFLAWDLIHRKLGYKCTIFTKFPIDAFGPDAFKKDVKILPEGAVNFLVPFNETDDVSVSVTLSTAHVNASNPYACNVEVFDTIKRRLFITEMNARLAKVLLDHKDYYDEVHMAYITGNYDGMIYQETMKKYPALSQKIYVNQFASKMEYEDAKYRRLKIGRLYQ